VYFHFKNTLVFWFLNIYFRYVSISPFISWIIYLVSGQIVYLRIFFKISFKILLLSIISILFSALSPYFCLILILFLVLYVGHWLYFIQYLLTQIVNIFSLTITSAYFINSVFVISACFTFSLWTKIYFVTCFNLQKERLF
jgi:hypothetical protein